MSYYKLTLTILGLLLSIFVGVIRYFTGPEWALSLFYLFPICAVTWYVGRRAGILIAIISATSWLTADLMMKHTFSNTLIPFLNETFRLLVFLITTFVLSALKNALVNQKKLAKMDPLTGVANRRAFLESLSIEMNRSHRFKLPFSVMYIDLDNFKTINDHFGHSTGDTLLRSVAVTIKNNIRTIDVLARLGGDEFVILLPETGAESVCAVAHKLQVKLLTLMQKNEWRVTSSIGVITFNSPPFSVDEVIKEADILMYCAKQDGKNMIKQRVVNE